MPFPDPLPAYPPTTGGPPAIPTVPAPLAALVRPLPLAPLSLALTAMVGRLANDHPSLFRRLGPHGAKRFLLDPTDLPLSLLLDLSGLSPRVTCHRTPPPAACRIAGPLAALLGMVHGTYDGDALFFSRVLLLEGDTAAALALRNAIDDAELDLSRVALARSGPLEQPLRHLVRLVESVTRVPLQRADWGADGVADGGMA